MQLIFAGASDSIPDRALDPEAPALPVQLRILLVDDDPIILKSLRGTLEAEGHLVATANGGQLGIEAFRDAQQGDRPFDLVITDLGIPFVDGRKLAQSIKEISPTTPVVLLTGSGQRMGDEGETQTRVDRVLGKPPKLRELREVLSCCCRRAEP